MTERDLSDLTRERSGIVDKHFDIDEQISGTNFLTASMEHGHLNIAFEYGSNFLHINIPNINARIFDTKYGIVASV